MHTQHNSILRSVPTAPRNLSLPPSYRMCISCSPVPLRRLCQASLEEEVRDTRCRLHWAILSFPSKRGSSTTQINPQNRWPAGAPKRELAARVRHWRARVTDAVSMADRNQVALQSCCRRGDLLVLAGPRPEKPQCRQRTLSQARICSSKRLTSAWQPVHARLTRSTAEKSQKPMNQPTPDNVRSVSTLSLWSVVPGRAGTLGLLPVRWSDAGV